MDQDVVGNRISRRRQELELTQEDLAIAMQLRGHHSLKQTRISEIEAGRRYVRPAELIGFSRVLRISVLWLLGVSDTE